MMEYQDLTKEIEEQNKKIDGLVISNEAINEAIQLVLEELDYIHKNRYEDELGYL